MSTRSKIHISLMSNRGYNVNTIMQCHCLALGWIRLASAYRAVLLARLASRLASASPAACSSEDPTECQQYMVVVDRSGVRVTESPPSGV